MSCVSDPTPYAGSCVGMVAVPTRWESIHNGLRAAATQRHVPSCESAAVLWVFVPSRKAFACARILLLPFLMLMPASVLGRWGFFMGSEYSPIIGTAVARWAFQPSMKAFMCRSRAAAKPSQSCTKTHSYFCRCSSTIGSHANLGSTQRCVQCCQGSLGDRNEFIVHAMTSINLKIVMLSERSQ